MEETKQRLAKLKEKILDTTDEVAAALESGDRAIQLQIGPKVPPLADEYQALLLALPESERGAVERTLGRMVTDMRRQAAQLAQRPEGRKAERAVDAGVQPFLLRRDPGRVLHPEGPPPPRTRPTYAVGGEVEAWCGKCKELRAHNIVVVVDGMPKQVSCIHCKSRHGYRTEPILRGADAEAARATPAPTGNRSVVSAQAQREREERQRFEDELRAAEVKPFDPKDNFKTGQVIQHPRFGRGRIESVLKGSILVRFIDGRRQVSRQ
ncbi:MAG: hypothetical protein U1A78_06080 [Polyangia bacterium]